MENTGKIIPYGGANPRAGTNVGSTSQTPKRKFVEEGSSSSAHPEPRKLFIPIPSDEVWNNLVAANTGGFAVTGTAAAATAGHVLGGVDIAESAESYLFRVSLAGVKRNPEDFSCSVANSGKVTIQGQTTTGEATVQRHSQVFVMQSQNLCASGYFTIRFALPGPVVSESFTGNFGADGILEGIVKKAPAVEPRAYRF